MCTAISFLSADHYFGRNLDLNRSYGEEICVLPRSYPLSFRLKEKIFDHYAIIGMATVVDGTPLFYDGANEHGLAMAGLNFPHNAHYSERTADKDNITPFEFIPWILSQCKTVDDALGLLEKINLVNIPFSDSLPLAELHWMLCDRNSSIVIEPMADGLHIHKNPVGVMTNNPPFSFQLFSLNNYRNISTSNGENRFAENMQLDNYCQGLGGIGIPGDTSSMSRFARTAFALKNSVCQQNEESSVSQFFHLLSFAEMPRGICRLENGDCDITVYSACINTTRGLFYYTTYDNRRITVVDMHKTDLDGTFISRYPLITASQILSQN